MNRTRVAIPVLVALALVAGRGGEAVADPPAPVVVAPASVIEIPRTTCMRGSDVRSLDWAIRLCREHSEGLAATACLPDVFSIEHPQREITVSAFRIDRTEVTQAAYGACVARGECRAPRRLPGDPTFAGDDLPVVGVRWSDAVRYCASVRGRLPTEAEWECAARGRTSLYFPWGDAWDGRLANHGRAGRRVDGADGFRALSPVGSYADGSSPAGLVDVAGNAAEWVADPYVVDAYERSVSFDPIARGGSGLRIVRGGSYLAMPHELRTSARRIEAEDASTVDIGFRCVYDVPRAEAEAAPELPPEVLPDDPTSP